MIIQKIRRQGVQKVVGVPKTCGLEVGDFVVIKKVEIKIPKMEDSSKV